MLMMISHAPMLAGRLLFMAAAGALLAPSPLVAAQTRPARPALIRDTDAAEGKDAAEASKEKPFNPLEAERNFRVGEFYSKRKNYSAAIRRYLDAIEYQPNLVKAYSALARAYEKSGDIDKAKSVYRDFIQKHPGSRSVQEFQSKLARLEKAS